MLLTVHECKICGLDFPSGVKLGAHYGTHRAQARQFHEFKSDAARKRFLIRELGHMCQVCINSKWQNLPIPIELDHIDGNSENNLRENLRLICPNCHAQTPTYKGKNIGRGPSTRSRRAKKHYDLHFAPIA